MKAIVVDAPGDTSVLKLKDIPKPKPKAHDLLIEVHASALNRLDIIQRQAIFTPADQASKILGIETAGVVVECGSEVKDFKVGDRVFGFINGGGYAEYCLMDEKMAYLMPGDWDFIFAAAIPEVFITAAERLFTNGRLQSGQTVLIHAGASGVGIAAIQLAKYVNAKVIITAGSDEKIKECLALGADLGINYKTEDFVERVLAETNQQGVDLILDSIGPDYLLKNQTALKTDGILILMGILSGSLGEIDVKQLIYKRQTILGNNLTRRSLESQREVCQRFMRDWMPILKAGKIKPIIDSVFPMTEVAKAHQRMEDNLNIGKIILQIKTS